jgi:hypothetical protein
MGIGGTELLMIGGILCLGVLCLIVIIAVIVGIVLLLLRDRD